jgi:hypothetical protein
MGIMGMVGMNIQEQWNGFRDRQRQTMPHGTHENYDVLPLAIFTVFAESSRVHDRRVEKMATAT